MNWANTTPESLFSQATPTTIVGRITQHPLFRPFVVVLFLMPIVIFNSVLVSEVFPRLQEPVATYVDIVRLLVSIPLILISYQWYCRSYEKRSAFEIDPNDGIVQWVLGATVAAVMVLVFVGLIELVGDYRIVEVRGGTRLLVNFLTFTAGALLQDMVLLCILYRLLEEFIGTWVSLLISLSLFGVVHLLNAEQSIASAVMLMFSSLIIVAPFILTRKLWVTWGFHAGWNFMQAGVFGMMNSGVAFKGWFVAEIAGPEWVTGGSIGLEGTYHSMAIDFLIGLAVMFLAVRYQKIVKPRWARRTQLSKT